MIEYATPLLLTLCMLGLAIAGAFFYAIGCSDEREHAKQEYEAENAKLRKYAKLMHGHINECCNACGERCICDIDALTRELGIEVD